MSLSTYSELQDDIVDFMERTDQTGKAPAWIKLAEARLNRELGPVETNASLTGVVGSRSLDISSLSVVQPIALFIADPGTEDERLLPPANPASMARYDSNARPSEVAYEVTELSLNSPCDLAYAFRFRYRQRFALSDDAPTNWLLTNHPDVYLAAAIVWGNAYNQDIGAAAAWKGILDESIPSIRNVLAKSRKGLAKVDPALTVRGGSLTYSEWVVAS